MITKETFMKLKNTMNIKWFQQFEISILLGTQRIIYHVKI